MKNQLLQDAVVDAKAIRTTALMNAKRALEETLSPKLQEMFDSQIEDEFSSDLDESDELGENINLDAILAELEDEDSLLEAKDDDDKKDDDKADKDKDADKEDKKDDKPKDDKDDKPKTPSTPKEPKDDFASAPGFDSLDGEQEDELVKDLSVEELKTIIGDIVNSTFDSEDAGLDGGLEDDSLVGDLGQNNDLNAPQDDLEGGLDSDLGVEDDDEFSLEELLSELDGLDTDVVNEGEDELAEVKAELNEAMKIVNSLRKTLHEVNLTNSKLLFLNKLFKAKNLNESQKTRAVEAFDKATSAKEAKLVYESLSVSLTTVAKRAPIRENKTSFASGLIRNGVSKVSAKQPILEVDANIKRMQVLAGIN